jgi:hypothetical protein
MTTREERVEILKAEYQRLEQPAHVVTGCLESSEYL